MTFFKYRGWIIRSDIQKKEVIYVCCHISHLCCWHQMLEKGFLLWRNTYGDLIHLVDFWSFFKRKTTFVTSCLFFCTLSLFKKGVYTKRKEFAPLGGKFFPFMVDPFSEGRQNNLTESPPLNVYPFSLKLSIQSKNFSWWHFDIFLFIFPRK